MAHAHVHHGHHHAHSHAPADYGRAFAVGVLLNGAFVVAELVWGTLSHSLSLLADAGHNASDVLGLLLSWGAALLSGRPASSSYTFGLRRSSILAALLNALLLTAAVLIIGWEALLHLAHPAPVQGGTVIWVALAGIAVNGVTAWLFASGRRGDLNLRAAFQHMLADATLSAGVVVAGGLILLTGWLWLDPLVSLLLAAVILYTSGGLLRSSLRLLLDGVPEELDAARLRSWLLDHGNVASLHALHIWGLSTTETALSAHLVCPGGLDDAGLAALRRGLHDRFGVEECTLQVERTPCEAAGQSPVFPPFPAGRVTG